MDSHKRFALIAIGLFLATVALVLLVQRGGVGLAPAGTATELPLADCDLQAGPCHTSLPGGGRVELTFDHRPIRPMEDFTLRLRADGVELTAAVVAFTGVDMNMGLNRFRFHPADGQWQAGAILPICVRDRMRWEARLRLQTPTGVVEWPLQFDTEKQ